MRIRIDYAVQSATFNVLTHVTDLHEEAKRLEQRLAMLIRHIQGLPSGAIMDGPGRLREPGEG